MRILILLIAFLLLTNLFLIVSNNNLYLNKTGQIKLLVKEYTGSLANIFEKANSITSFVIKTRIKN